MPIELKGDMDTDSHKEILNKYTYLYLLSESLELNTCNKPGDILSFIFMMANVPILPSSKLVFGLK